MVQQINASLGKEPNSIIDSNLDEENRVLILGLLRHSNYYANQKEENSGAAILLTETKNNMLKHDRLYIGRSILFCQSPTIANPIISGLSTFSSFHFTIKIYCCEATGAFMEEDIQGNSIVKNNRYKHANINFAENKINEL